MNEKDIEQLFEKVAKHWDIYPGHAKEVFSILIKTTLGLRDELVRRKEPPLTVGEVEKALDVLVILVQKGKYGEKLPSRIADLVSRWVEALNRISIS